MLSARWDPEAITIAGKKLREPQSSRIIAGDLQPFSSVILESDRVSSVDQRLALGMHISREISGHNGTIEVDLIGIRRKVFYRPMTTELIRSTYL